MLKGSGLGLLWPNAVLLVAYTLVLFGLAAARFHKRIS